MLILILIILLVLILFGAYAMMGRDLISPPVVFVGPFLVASICAAAYSECWQLNMHFNTFLVLLIGCFEFMVVCCFIHYSIGIKLRKRAQILNQKTGINTKEISISFWKILIIIVIQVFSVIIVIKDLRNIVGRYGISGNLSIIMYWFRQFKMFEDKNVMLSSLSSNIRLFSIAVSYIWIYVVCNNFICKKKQKNIIFLLISITLGLINSVILGSRGEAIQLIMSVIIMYFFLKRKYNGWRINIKMRQLFLIAIVLLIIMYGFKSFGDLLGRSSVVDYGVSAVDEVAKYLGAEIKNLDIYLNEPFQNVEVNVPGSQTFGTILSWIDNKLHLGWNIKKDLPFQKVNGISLGNVYTIFYAYIYDFGYIGMIMINLIMAVCVQLFYEYAVIEKAKTKINCRIILNSYILFLVAFSFFGERFFSYVLNISFIKYLFIWKLVIWFVISINFNCSIKNQIVKGGITN